MSKNTLTITDNRTGKTYEIPVADGAIRTADLRQIKTSDDDFGLMGYDPAYLNTASCRSAITLIDGDKGILRYRGYPIEQLAEKSSYLETAYLLLHGELPSTQQLTGFIDQVSEQASLPDNIKGLIASFPRDAHPMTVFLSAVGALSTFYPESKRVLDKQQRMLDVTRLIAKVPIVAAWSMRHRGGQPFVQPEAGLSYTGNFLAMLNRKDEAHYKPNPVLEKALDVLFILHADHEQNCSTSVMRGAGSSQVDPYSAVAAATAALYGPLHGGANEAVLRMLAEIGSLSNVPAFIKEVKEGKGEKKLMGFGHRVYKNYDPRAKVIKRLAEQVFEVTGRNPLLDIAVELERIALQDEYFVKRKLYPNVDFYSGLIYQAMGFPADLFTVLFALGRTSGWLAQWCELLEDAEQKIARPRQLYVGIDKRDCPSDRPHPLEIEQKRAQ